jgi:hypothetical protein
MDSNFRFRAPAASARAAAVISESTTPGFRASIPASLASSSAALRHQCGGDDRLLHVDKGYRGNNHAQKFRVWISGQVRRVTAPIRREMRRPESEVTSPVW